MIINRARHVIISRHNGSEASGHTQYALSALFKASTTNGRKYQSLVWGARHRENPEGILMANIAKIGACEVRSMDV